MYEVALYPMFIFGRPFVPETKCLSDTRFKKLLTDLNTYKM